MIRKDIGHDSNVGVCVCVSMCERVHTHVCLTCPCMYTCMQACYTCARAEAGQVGWQGGRLVGRLIGRRERGRKGGNRLVGW